jgi:hypothetical protein
MVGALDSVGVEEVFAAEILFWLLRLVWARAPRDLGDSIVAIFSVFCMPKARCEEFARLKVI